MTTKEIMAEFISVEGEEKWYRRILQYQRESFQLGLLPQLPDMTYDEVKILAPKIVQYLYAFPGKHGIPLDPTCPAHAGGHFLKCYAYMLGVYLKLDQDPKLMPREVYRLIGAVSGGVCDIGAWLMPRYEEEIRCASRHAETGGIFVMDALSYNNNPFGLHPSIITAFGWDVCASSNYRPGKDGTTKTVKCRDGVTRSSYPYVQYYADGSPLHFIWDCRAIDRGAGGSGAFFALRDIIASIMKHLDHAAGKNEQHFFLVTLETKLRNLMRSRAANIDDKTFFEHWRTYRDSQTSPEHGPLDRGCLIDWRDFSLEILARIIALGRDPYIKRVKTREYRSEIFDAFKNLIVTNGEPSPAGKKAADELISIISQLDDAHQNMAGEIFLAVMEGYKPQLEYLRKEIEWCPEWMLALPPISDNIRDTLKPGDWTRILKTR